MGFVRIPGRRFNRGRVPVTVGGAPAGTFSPLDIAGCVAWFDMQDAGSFTVAAGEVSAITNKVSSVSWTEATNRPAYAATGLNSLPCMDFDGTNDQIIDTEAAVFGALTNAAAYTLFYVAALNTIDRNEAIFGVGDSAQAANRARYWGQSSSGLGRHRSDSINDAGTLVTVIGSVAPDTTAHVYSWYSPGTTVSLSTDQAAANPNATAQNPGTLTPNRSALGCRPRTAPDQFFDGQLGEFLLYNSELSGADRTTVAAYLKTRWSTP